MPGYANSSGQMDVVDYMRMIERRLARLERGTQGSAGGDDPVVIVALNITGLTLSTQTTIVSDDFYRVMMRYSWTAVSDDPSEYNKDRLDGYLTSWSLDGVNYTAERFTSTTNIDVGPFNQGQSVTFRVRARTVKGTKGNFASITNSTTTDATAPFQPATPTVVPYLGQLRITWSGLDVSSNQPPTDFRFVEVHLSTTGPTFTPTVATLIGTILRGGGAWVATDLAYGTTHYSRLVAVDTVGNRSPASTAGSAIPEQLVNADMGPNSIATANIQNLAVNNAKIADLSVGKLTAGTLTADMTVSARIKTANTGARVELNSLGLQAFNSGGTQTVAFNSADGSAVLTGTIFTGFVGSGQPYLTIQDSGDRTTIFFIGSAGGSDYAFINSPADVSGKPRLGLNTAEYTMLGVTTARSRLFLNNGFIQLETNGPGGQLGYCLVMSAATLTMQRTTAANQLTGGSFEADANTFWMRHYALNVVDGGNVTGDNGSLYLDCTNGSGVVKSRIQLDDTESIWFKGRFVQDNGDSGVSALFVGTFAAAANLNFIVTYGVTMATRPQVVYGVQSTATVGQHQLTSFTTTQFQYTQANNIAINLNYWCFRTT